MSAMVMVVVMRSSDEEENGINSWAPSDNALHQSQAYTVRCLSFHDPVLLKVTLCSEQADCFET